MSGSATDLGNCVFSVMLYTVSWNDTAFACYIFDIHHLSICPPLSPPARRRTIQLSFETATDTISDEENVDRQRSRRSAAMSRYFAMLGAYRRDHSASWLATLEWTHFRPRRRRSRQHVPGTSEAAAAVFFETRYTAWLKRRNFRGSCFQR